MPRIEFTVFGIPKAQGRPRGFAIPSGPKKGKVRVYDPETSRNWKADVKAQALVHRPPVPLDCPLRVRFTFTLLRPKSLPKRIVAHTRRPDVDNLGKAVADALRGVIYRDDSLIIEKVVRKKYGPSPGVHVIVEEVT